MKKYLFALTAFLLIPTGAFAQSDEAPNWKGDVKGKVYVYTAGSHFGEWSNSYSLKEWDTVLAKLQDRLNIHCPMPGEDVEEEPEAPSEGNEEEQPEPEAPSEGNEEEGTNDEDTETGNDSMSQFEQEVVDLTNEERTARGLEPLEAYTDLSDVARVKSEDMRDNNYFSHDSLDTGHLLI
ncbi:CAP domain-containing protein [Geomicrobium sp. JCM 19039]|uniref:CAP domain-containing protein n=1 Tax=Geomicrobium sp. JCM 19039 TaxID=1460636 RepID=UPI00045F1291|nr:transporter [Geomicrobium sp. JCM 19039]